MKGSYKLTDEERNRIALLLKAFEDTWCQDAMTLLTMALKIHPECEVLVDASDWHILDGPGMGNPIVIPDGDEGEDDSDD